MKQKRTVFAMVGLAFGLLVGPASAGVAGASPAASGSPVPAAAPVAPLAPVRTSAQGSLVAPLNHGWISTDDEIGIVTEAEGLASPSPIGFASGPTGVGATTDTNVVSGTMKSASGIYQVQVSLPVGQTFTLGEQYVSLESSLSVVVSWPGGGCESVGISGIATATVNQLTRAVSGAASSYAVQFLCVSSTYSVEGAFAFNVVPTTPHQGYYTYDSEGDITGFGNDNYLNYLGSLVATNLNQPIVGMATTPDGGGYWLVAADGGIFAFGDAKFYGSMGAAHLNQPIVGMATTGDGKGYWMVAADGGIFAFGDAKFHGSMGATHLNQPIVGMTPSPSGGYRLVAADGGIFSFGATFYGSMGGKTLNQPIAGMAATPDGKGYWMVASDGGIFSFGDATYYGSMGSIPLNAPVVGMGATQDGHGYWLVGEDGGIFAFGDAPFYGSLGLFSGSNAAGIAS